MREAIRSAGAPSAGAWAVRGADRIAQSEALRIGDCESTAKPQPQIFLSTGR